MILKRKLESVFGGDSDERAVSPVIGVILMVAITVILAAVIAVFVTDLGGSQGQAPQASFSQSDGQIVHQGGDSINTSAVTVVGGSGNWDDGGDGTLDAGDTYSGTGSRVVWNDPDSDQSAVLAEFE